MGEISEPRAYRHRRPLCLDHPREDKICSLCTPGQAKSAELLRPPQPGSRRAVQEVDERDPGRHGHELLDWGVGPYKGLAPRRLGVVVIWAPSSLPDSDRPGVLCSASERKSGKESPIHPNQRNGIVADEASCVYLFGASPPRCFLALWACKQSCHHAERWPAMQPYICKLFLLPPLSWTL